MVSEEDLEDRDAAGRELAARMGAHGREGAPTPHAVNEWQLIETAPRHYTPVLLRDGAVVGEGCHATHMGWEFFNPSHILRRNPTHWMPLPTFSSTQEREP